METYSLTRNSVLGKVFFGLSLSLVAAFAGVFAGQFVPLTITGLLMIVELGMIIVAMFLHRRRAIGMPFVLTFTFISGITLWPTLNAYIAMLGADPVLKGIGVSAIAFLVSAVVAARSSVDFSFLGGFLFVGLIAIVAMGFVSLFVGFSSMTELVYSLLGVAVFIGYVLFDVNRLVRHGVAESAVPWVVLSLYLDFINLLLFVLRLLGVLQSSRR